jgi:hypothetical protein
LPPCGFGSKQTTPICCGHGPRRWREAVCREISAATEGMATRGASDNLIRELAQIEEAINCLAE